ncbi:ABC transporter ATP-binding protein/permease [Lacrimispora sp. NSJ-141]|uniref:ABC transporter ATP-binding protein/permease n=1 Tax=Lientehia hominis TaxID=2897778 RepID=A0AAP2RFD4_9FIRM|nr:ABC transporter ATP-binding protein [Lientehia hominis]MCD2491207.1 ABC transporter ATP-binding protein/permease [Lientehia hominis]
MTKILKYLRKSAGWVLLILALLGLQAFCDLSLPAYTSDIVDVGIQQGGISHVSPEVIRQTEMEKLLRFMDEEEREAAEASYTRISKESLTEEEFNKYAKKYPELRSQDLLLRNDMEKEDLETLDGIMSGPAVSLLMAEKNGMDVSVLPEEAVSQIRGEMDKQMAALSDSIMDQMGITYVKAEYQAVGININKLQTDYLWSEGLQMLGIALLSMAASVLVCLIASRVAASVGMRLRGQVFSKVVSFSNAEMDKFSTSSLITRSTNDIQQVQLVVVLLLRMVLYAPIIGIGGLVRVLRTNTSMAWIIAVAVAAVSCLVAVLMVVAMPKFQKMQKLVDRLNLVTREILTGLPVIRAFSREKHEEKRFDDANRDLTRTMLFTNRCMTFMMPAMMLIMNGITVLIIWTGAHGIDSGNIQVGDMMAFITYTMQIIMAFLMITMISIMLPRASVAAHRIDEILVTEPSIKEKKSPARLPKDKKGVVEFKHVSFRYPGAENDVLHDIDFVAKPGETTAFIGSTGSGKSTLVNLLPRLYDVTEGAITLDGVDIRDLSEKELRSQIGFVPQKGVLFSGTIASNLRFGQKDATDEEIRKAAEIAQASDFIEEKPDKYDSHIAQGGANVSGGQKQRLSIARAVAKKPPVYVFDDSFSALDFKTDTALRRALKDQVSDSTMLIVAQRVSTILHAEQIIVLDEGSIVGKGTHEELLKTNEIYRQIAQSQLSEAELSGTDGSSGSENLEKEVADNE